MAPTNRMSDQQMMERSLPSAPESERTILGTVLLDNELAHQAVEALSAEDFYSPMHKRVFAAMCELYTAKRNIDHINLGDVLSRDNSLEAIGGIPAIVNLTYGLPYLPDISDAVEIVRQKAIARQTIRQLSKITEDVLAQKQTVEEILQSAQASIGNLYLDATTTGPQSEHFIPLKQIVLQELIPDLERMVKGEQRKISTGFNAIDNAIGGGISTSDVMLIAGLPGCGKSALALQMAFQCAAKGNPSAFIAGEMTNLENCKRLISQLSGVQNLNALNRISEEERKLVHDWALHVADTPIYLERRLSDLHSIGARLRVLVRQYGIKLVVFDYVQLFKAEKLDKRQRVERIAEVSQEIKRIANELDLAVISVAQFNREGAKAGTPSMHDMEGSGQLEKDASLIFIIDRQNRSEDVDLRIVKGRNTGTTTIPGRFHGRSVRFEI